MKTFSNVKVTETNFQLFVIQRIYEEIFCNNFRKVFLITINIDADKSFSQR